MASAAPAPILQPSALTSLIATSTPTPTSTSYGHPPHLTALAQTVLHNLAHQHAWSSLTIHHTSCSPSSSNPSALLPRPLISGIPPRRAYTHPDMQIQLIKEGISEEDVEAERVWVVPSVLRERWTLRVLGEVFAGVPSPWEARGKEGRKWPGDDTKRALLATVDEDSTVVYYVVHDGIVKPRQN